MYQQEMHLKIVMDYWNWILQLMKEDRKSRYTG